MWGLGCATLRRVVLCYKTNIQQFMVDQITTTIALNKLNQRAETPFIVAYQSICEITSYPFRSHSPRRQDAPVSVPLSYPSASDAPHSRKWGSGDIFTSPLTAALSIDYSSLG
jgi:hypothetical protein